MKELHKQEREQLMEVISTLRNDIETIKRQIRRIEDEKKQFIQLKESAKAKKKRLKEILDNEKKVRIRELEEAKMEV